MAEQNQVATNEPEVKVVKQPTLDKPPTAAPAFTIRKARPVNRFLNGMIYGDYGTGKSFLGASSSLVPEMQRVLYLNAEGGDLAVEHFDMDIIDITNYTQFARVHEFLKLHCRLRDLCVQGDKEAREKLRKLEALFKGVELEDIEEPTLYNTVVGDTLTEIQKYCMYQLLGIKVGEFQLDASPDIPEIGDWGRSAEMIRLLVRTFRDLPIHVIFICARDEVQDQHKRFHYNPLLPGKLSKEIRGFFDFVGYLVAAPTEGGEMLRRLWLTPGATFAAKNRFKDFHDLYVDDPSMEKLVQLRHKE